MGCNCGQAVKRQPASKQVTKKKVVTPAVKTTTTRRVIKRPAR